MEISERLAQAKKSKDGILAAEAFYELERHLNTPSTPCSQKAYLRSLRRQSRPVRELIRPAVQQLVPDLVNAQKKAEQLFATAVLGWSALDAIAKHVERACACLNSLDKPCNHAALAEFAVKGEVPTVFLCQKRELCARLEQCYSTVALSLPPRTEREKEKQVRERRNRSERAQESRTRAGKSPRGKGKRGKRQFTHSSISVNRWLDRANNARFLII